MPRAISWACFSIAFALFCAPEQLRADAVSLPDCLALNGLSDCLVLFQVGPNLVPTALQPAGLTETEEANGSILQLTSPPVTINYTEGSLISDRVTITGFTVSFSSDPHLEDVPTGVTPIILPGEMAGLLQVVGFSFQDFAEGSAISDSFTLTTETGPRTAVIMESQEPFTVTFSQPLTVIDFLEPPTGEGNTGTVEDRLIIGPFTVTFTSDDESGLPPVSGAISVPEANTNSLQNAVGVLALSDVPEPSALFPIAGALSALAIVLRRRRRKTAPGAKNVA